MKLRRTDESRNSMEIKRRTFLKTSGVIIASLLTAGKTNTLKASQSPKILYGKEISGRCPLCSLGCGLIYRSRGPESWHVEGDPDCPVAGGSLCARGAALAEPLDKTGFSKPLYRPPGSAGFQEIEWGEAVNTITRRLKDLRDRDLGLFSTEGDEMPNRFDSLGIITGGCLTNEESYTVSKLFRSLGVTVMDTSVRASHGMAISGLLDTLGFPAATHPPTQVSYSDVVVLVGCNPGQTAPALCRFLDKVRRRRGVVIVVDPRRSETIKKEDLWLQLRPGTDNAVLGALLNWVLQYAEIRKSDLIKNSDAAFMVLSEIMGEYERHSKGKNKNQRITDETLTEPYSIFQRMKEHFKRYDLRKISGISGTDVDLLRRASTLLARTASPHFSATFVLGSGALASPSGADTVRIAAFIQAVLGNLDKMGGGIVLPVAAGNAQGVCDMGLLAPYLPGYIKLPVYKKTSNVPEDEEPLKALLRTWYPSTDTKRSVNYLPHLESDENPSLSTIIQSIGDEQVRALITIGSDPLGSLTDNSSMMDVLDSLDLLVVMDSMPNQISRFWKRSPGKESTLKTEVIFIPTELPAMKKGSMTDPGRRVRIVRPVQTTDNEIPGLLEFMVNLGNSMRAKYEVEGGVHPGPVLELDWPLTRVPEQVAAEINGWRQEAGRERALSPGRSWQEGDRCGNRLYRGWLGEQGWFAERRDHIDHDGVGLYDKWGWFWPWGIADPFSWAREGENEKGSFLWLKKGDQTGRTAADLLPLRPHLPIKFWKLVEKGNPLPEHYEPFHSPLPDFLTGGQSNPNLQIRNETGEKWGYLSRRPEEVLPDYPVIIMVHRTGNIMGTGGVTAIADSIRELGIERIVEIGRSLARELGVVTGDKLVISSPYYSEGVSATALVTGRIGSFERDRDLNHIASVTLYGDNDAGANALTPPVFDYHTGGIELKVFMGRLTKGRA